MDNPYISYYTNQAGSGLAGFEGYRYQRGHGFFGDLWNNHLKPLGKYVGNKLLGLGVDVGKDILSGKSLGQAAKRRLLETGAAILNDGSNKTKEYIQEGSGRRRRRRSRKKIKQVKNIVKRKTIKRKAKKKKRKTKKKTVKKRRSKKKGQLFNF